VKLFDRGENNTFRFDDAHVLHSGDPVVILGVYAETANPVVNGLLKTPAAFDAFFMGCAIEKDRRRRLELTRTLARLSAGIDLDSRSIPRLGIILPKDLVGTPKDALVTLRGNECDWTLPDIYTAALDAITDQDVIIPGHLQ
jgi:hypothetical protein